MDRLYQCRCGLAGSDQGELEAHIILDGECSPGPHEPVDPTHVSARLRDHLATQQRRVRVRAAVADAAGVTVDELREVLG